MTDTSPNATTAATPEEELAALLVRVADLSRLSVSITQHCFQLQERIPAVVAAHVAALSPGAPEFEVGVAITPKALERRFPPGVGDLATWYVVAVGREPGLFISSDEAEDQVKGVPNFCREKKKSRREALDFYRHKYEHREVMKLTEVAEDVPSDSQPRPSASQTVAPPPSQSRRYSAVKITVTVG
ncbi:hypothetical protein B0H13DRAFT_2571223 [Mycena leptocephala]|nr:hypothetical protein B0H13DRAFT_2571223 [Mycena leptocephala]